MKKLAVRLLAGLNQMLTETDNETQDLFRWLAVLVIPVAVGMEVYSVIYLGEKFDLEQFGLGVGALFISVGSALALKPESKSKSEVDSETEQKQ